MFLLASPLPFAHLRSSFEGDLYFDQSPEHTAQRKLYSTDASVYQEMPMAVALPKSVEDLKRLVRFAKQYSRPDAPVGLIPRAAGTSLAGQVVGNGIVVDISKYFGQILELNVAERWVRVQPGVIRDDLNKFLKPHGLMFGPETSTASRAMIGGMIGNNSCGLHSIVWGTTRDHLLEARTVLSDGAEVTFGSLTEAQYAAKCRGENIVSPLEQQLYQQFKAWLSDPVVVQNIKEGYPKPTVKRRNTGYAVDALLSSTRRTAPFSFTHLIAGSEGTLCFITEAKLNLLPVPPDDVALVCGHFQTLRESLEANLVALKHGCFASELVDDYILQLTKTNIEQAKNRAFVQGDPKAVLMVEFFAGPTFGEVGNGEEAGTGTSALTKAEAFVADLRARGMGYAHPILQGDETLKPWALRKAGLSIMYSIPGDDKPANVIEDCAVDPADLPDYMDELEHMAMKKHGL
ncbi:MAG: FAD-binding oxidoreductase, partial [Rudanella sp.]|nr:FAD-binding oxidoreductase [Rudanella sp.]